MRVFVAGGTGVLGRATISALIEAGHQVRATARGEEKARIARELGAQPVDPDLYDLASTRKALSGADAVLRLTTKFGPMSRLRDPSSWTETIRLRTEGAKVLVDAALADGAQVYIHESVSFVYSDGGEEWLTEDSPVDYSENALMQATLEGEREATRFTQAGRTGIVLRFGGFYGPEAPSAHEMIAMARRHLLFQFGPGSHYFSSIYVPDAGRAVVSALSAPEGVYNVCDDEPVSYAEYLRALTEAVGAPKPRRLPRIVGKWMMGGVWKYLSRSQKVSNAKLKAATGWTPDVKSVREGWPLIAAELAKNEEQGQVSDAA
jgi:nucleoside-diphosphate-sugar epimerase